MFRSPERQQMKREPIVRFSRPETVTDSDTGEKKVIEKKYVAVAGVELEVYEGKEGSIFKDEDFADFSIDEASLDLLKRTAIAVKLNQPLLLEGETDIGKSKAFEYLAHMVNRRVYRLSVAGQTDVSEFVGKYVPNTEGTQKTFERILRNRQKLTQRSKEILDNVFEDKNRDSLNEDECKEIAQLEGLEFGEKVQWVWQDGLIVQAMTHGNKRGAWLYLDELGAAEPQIIVKLNRIFENQRRLEIAENGNRLVEGGGDFRIFASTNPPEYAGRLPFAPDFLRRFVYQKIGSLTPNQVQERLAFVWEGQKTDAAKLLKDTGVVESEPLSLKENPKLSKAIRECLGELFSQLRTMVKDGAIGRDQRQQFRYEMTDLFRIGDYLTAFGGDDPEKMLKEAVKFYFAGKLGADADRTKVMTAFDAVFKAKATGKKIQEARAPREKEVEPPGLSVARSEAERAIAELAAAELAAMEGKFSSESGELTIRVRELAAQLDANINHRFSEQGRLETVTIKPPELPPGLTQEHLDTVREALSGGKGFEERVLPTLDDLRNLDETYVGAMYPETQSEADKTRGLVSYRPSWWKDNADKALSASGQTFGAVYLRSIRKELEALGGSLVQLDTATKPSYTDGKQQYGTKEGTDPAADPLLSLFKEAFGSDANRFSHSWDDLETKLLPLAKRKIAEALKAKGLSKVDFEVILVPATLDNLEMTFNHPESSSTNTWEWTSTTLMDDSGNDTGRRLVVGYSGSGGAGYVDYVARGDSLGSLGARLAVVWKK